jgi:hypothetical protein
MEAIHSVLTANLDPRLAGYKLCNATTQERYYVDAIMFYNGYRLTAIFIGFIPIKMMTCEEL